MKKVLIILFICIVTVYVCVLCVMYLFQEKLIFFPQKLPTDYRFQFSTSFEEVWIRSGDVRLNSLLFTKPQSKGVILFFHGNAGSLESWGELYQDFQSFPYDLWILDYRGYGKSEGKIDSESSLHKDAIALYKTAQERYKNKDTIIYGRSIGTGIAAKLASEYPPKILFLETPYYNFPDLVQSIYPFVPSFLLKYKLETDQYIQEQGFPIHLFHGDKDALIPYHCSQRLEALSSNITLHTIEGAEHNNIAAFSSYHQLLNNILLAEN